MKIAIVYHSIGGHTRQQAEAVARGAGNVEGASVELLAAAERFGRRVAAATARWIAGNQGG